MTRKLVLLLLPAFLLIACSKKEEAPQTQQTQGQQQVTQPPVQQNQQQTQITEQKKEEDKKKEDAKKVELKKEDLKKVLENTQKADSSDKKLSSDIDFAPIFAKKCAKCHGKDGKGKSSNAPDFTSAKFKQKTDKELFKAITNGIKSDDPDGDDMPSWKGKLSDEEIKAAIKFVKGL